MLMMLTLIMLTVTTMMIWTICRQDARESGRCLKAAFPQTGLDIKMHSSFTVMMTITMLKFRHETYDLFTYTKRRADFFCSLSKFPDLGYILQYMEDSRCIIFCSLFDELPPYNMFSNMWKIATLQYFSQYVENSRLIIFFAYSEKFLPSLSQSIAARQGSWPWPLSGTLHRNSWPFVCSKWLRHSWKSIKNSKDKIWSKK